MMPKVKNPADEALEHAFGSVALKQRKKKVDVLLEEADRLIQMELVDFIRHEPIDFYLDRDPEFPRAMRTALTLVSNVNPSHIDYISFRPAKELGKRSIYVVLKSEAQRICGAEAVVSEACWVNAWNLAGP